MYFSVAFIAAKAPAASPLEATAAAGRERRKTGGSGRAPARQGLLRAATPAAAAVSLGKLSAQVAEARITSL